MIPKKRIVGLDEAVAVASDPLRVCRSHYRWFLQGEACFECAVEAERAETAWEQAAEARANWRSTVFEVQRTGHAFIDAWSVISLDSTVTFQGTTLTMHQWIEREQGMIELTPEAWKGWPEKVRRDALTWLPTWAAQLVSSDPRVEHEPVALWWDPHPQHRAGWYTSVSGLRVTFAREPLCQVTASWMVAPVRFGSLLHCMRAHPWWDR